MILAVDTSSALTSVAVVDGSSVVIERSDLDARRHAESIGPMLAEVCAAVPQAAIDAVACGVGPGPYTGLRVGIASAIALGLAWEVPVYGLCSLDAIAAQVRAERPGLDGMVVASDARRREVYWAQYDRLGRRVAGPRVMPAEDAGVEAAQAHAAWVGRRVAELLAAGEGIADVVPRLDAHGDDTGASAASLAGAALLPPRALYLRRPDAMEPTVPSGART